jgi:hypothetical protein
MRDSGHTTAIVKNPMVQGEKNAVKCRLSSEVDVVRKRYPPPTASSRQLERQNYDNEMEDHGSIAMKEKKGRSQLLWGDQVK